MYEYLLNSWGGVYNDNLIEKELGISEKEFWFSTKEERTLFKLKLKEIADKHNTCIVFSEAEGLDTRKKTVASMLMNYNGRKYEYAYDFGYGYSKDSAEFMFFDGNYSCDCNKSQFLSEWYPEIKELECGDEIKLENFKVKLMSDDKHTIISDKYHLIITNNSTNETRIRPMNVPFEEYSDWWLTEGNYGCDCNRRIEFYRDEFPKLINDNYECTDGGFTIVAAILSNGCIIPIDEPYRDKEEFNCWGCFNPNDVKPIFQYNYTSLFYDTDLNGFLSAIKFEVGANNEF